jgi:hypothetical protein
LHTAYAQVRDTLPPAVQQRMDNIVPQPDLQTAYAQVRDTLPPSVQQRMDNIVRQPDLQTAYAQVRDTLPPSVQQRMDNIVRQPDLQTAYAQVRDTLPPSVQQRMDNIVRQPDLQTAYAQVRDSLPPTLQQKLDNVVNKPDLQTAYAQVRDSLPPTIQQKLDNVVNKSDLQTAYAQVRDSLPPTIQQKLDNVVNKPDLQTAYAQVRDSLPPTIQQKLDNVVNKPDLQTAYAQVRDSLPPAVQQKLDNVVNKPDLQTAYAQVRDSLPPNVQQKLDAAISKPDLQTAYAQIRDSLPQNIQQKLDAAINKPDWQTTYAQIRDTLPPGTEQKLDAALSAARESTRAADRVTYIPASVSDALSRMSATVQDRVEALQIRESLTPRQLASFDQFVAARATNNLIVPNLAVMQIRDGLSPALQQVFDRLLAFNENQSKVLSEASQLVVLPGGFAGLTRNQAANESNLSTRLQGDSRPLSAMSGAEASRRLFTPELQVKREFATDSQQRQNSFEFLISGSFNVYSVTANTLKASPELEIAPSSPANIFTVAPIVQSTEITSPRSPAKSFSVSDGLLPDDRTLVSTALPALFTALASTNGAKIQIVREAGDGLLSGGAVILIANGQRIQIGRPDSISFIRFVDDGVKAGGRAALTQRRIIRSGPTRELIGIELAAFIVIAGIAKVRDSNEQAGKSAKRRILVARFLRRLGQVVEKPEPEPEISLNAQPTHAYKVCVRPIWFVSPGDTLSVIALRTLGDGKLGWLIADLNIQNVTESWIEGQRVIELRTMQRLELPVWEDIVEFQAHKPHDAAMENLVTIITERQIDRDAMTATMERAMGLRPATLPSRNTALPAEPEVRPAWLPPISIGAARQSVSFTSIAAALSIAFPLNSAVQDLPSIEANAGEQVSALSEHQQ